MNKIILKIDGMSCSACSNGLEKYLNKQRGIKSASVNLVMAQAMIEYDNSLTIDDLNRFVSEAGFESLGEYNISKEEKKDYTKYYLIILGILLLIMIIISMINIDLFSMSKNPINYSIILFLLTIPFIIFGFDIIKSGIKNIIHRMPNMDTLVTISVLSSLIYSFINMILIINENSSLVNNLYFESCAMVIYFVKIGRFIDKKSKEKTKEAIKELVTITPNKALLKIDNIEKEVTIDEVKKGDILICKPGMKVAVDGTIIEGNSHIDESFITGESEYKKKTINDKVVAGSINIDGYILYKAEHIGKDSTISQIVRLVVEATNTKMNIQRIADKVSSYFVPSVILIALLSLIINLLIGNSFNSSLIKFVTILVVSCPCALGLATPLAIVTSEGNAARKGILIKSSETLEISSIVDTVIFDKTGTLTYGNLRISKLFNYSNYKDNEIIKIVSSIEKLSNHPIKNAFKDVNNLKEITNYKNIDNIGIYGEINNKKYYLGSNKLFKKLNIKNNYKKDEDELTNDNNSIIYVIEDNKVISLIGVKDIIRNDSKKTINELIKLGKEVVMLSGDNKKTANSIASYLGIKTVLSECSPQDKENYLRNLNKENKIVMMVGDGINDAIALSSSQVGISFNSATDIAANSSNVILMNNNIYSIIELLTISKKTIRIIKQNLFWALFYNSLMIPIALGLFSNFGINLNPMYASIAMVISSLTVTFNSLRLRK